MESINVLYFGYGSNMSSANRAMKQIAFGPSKRGILRGWTLQFNFGIKGSVEEPAVANIKPGNADDEVHGVIFDMTPAAMAQLDALERYYDNPSLKIDIYAADGGGSVTALAYYCYPEHLSKFENPICHIADGLNPGKNYLETIIVGARENKLDPNYISKLIAQPSAPLLPHDFGTLRAAIEAGKVFKQGELEEGQISILGVVFFIPTTHPARILMMRHDPITMLVQRWAFSALFQRKVEEGDFQSIPEEMGRLKWVQLGQRKLILTDKLMEYLQRQVMQFSRLIVNGVQGRMEDSQFNWAAPDFPLFSILGDV